MIRQASLVLGSSVIPRQPYQLPLELPSRPRTLHTTNSSSINDDYKLSATRHWLTNLNKKSCIVPLNVSQVDGTVVSQRDKKRGKKLSTHVTLSTSLTSLAQCIPREMLPVLRESTFYKKESDALVMTSNEHTTKDRNTRKCRDRLNEVLVDTARGVVSGELSAPRTKDSIHTSFEPPSGRRFITREEQRALKTPVSISQLKASGADVETIRRAKKWDRERERLLATARIKP